MKKSRVDEFVKNPKKALFVIATPMVIAMLVHTMYNIVDTAYVGRLGTDAIAALTFSFPLFFILISLNAGLGAGINSRISRFLGEKNKKLAENTAVHGILISLVLALVIYLIGIVSIRHLFYLFGATDAVSKLGLDYMYIILIGAFFMFPSFAIYNIFNAQGDSKTAMKVQVITLIINIILDPIFIYVLGYGVKGAAIATVISFIFSITLYYYFIKTKSYLDIKLSSFNFSPKLVKEILKVGIPASLMMLSMSVYFMIINKFMSNFGTEYVAASGIAFRLESIIIMPVVAFSLSVLTLTGMFFGAKQYNLIKFIIKYSLKILIILTSLIGLIFFILPSLFLRIFTSDQVLLSLGSSYLRIEVFIFPLFAIVMIISRAMQGMGFGTFGFILSLIRLFVVALPIAYLFVFILNYNFLSIAIASIIGNLIAAIVAVIWFRNKMKVLANL